MAVLNLIQLYINVISKTLVSVNGSPTTIPSQFYGDIPTFQIFPVIPVSNNPSQGYQPVNLTGYTMNLIFSSMPNASTGPAATCASLDGMVWNGATNSFIGAIDFTQLATKNFIGNAANMGAFVCIDVFDNLLNRTTLYQTTSASVLVWASCDTPAVGPAGPAVQYLTVAQALNLFLQIGYFPGKFCNWQSPDGTKKVQQTLDNNGAMEQQPIP